MPPLLALRVMTLCRLPSTLSEAGPGELRDGGDPSQTTARVKRPKGVMFVASDLYSSHTRCNVLQTLSNLRLFSILSRKVMDAYSIIFASGSDTSLLVLGAATTDMKSS